jgi:hypothetical protein
MKERQKHIEAFECYISLGGKPTTENITKVAQESHTAYRTIWTWYKNFNWKERAEIRLNEIAKKLAEKTDNDIVNIKANHRKEIKQTLALIKSTLSNAIKNVNGKVQSTIEPEKATDIANLANSYEKLVKLDLLLLGEDTERSDNTVHFVIDSDIDVSKFPTTLNEDKEDE